MIVLANGSFRKSSRLAANERGDLVSRSRLSSHSRHRVVAGTILGVMLTGITAARVQADAGAEPSPPMFVTFETLAGSSSCEAMAISGDASTVVGECEYPLQAFVWTAESGTQSLGFLPGADQSWATGVSWDGSVIAGTSGRFDVDPFKRAFRWTANDGMVPLPPPPPGFFDSDAKGISSDGQVIVGNTYSGPPLFADQIGFRWTESTGMTTLGSLAPDPPFASRVHDISANGLVVVGASDPNHYTERPMRWTSTSGMQSLGAPGQAYAVSANGAVIVGFSMFESFRWTAATGAVIFGGMEPFAVSADGSVLAGREVFPSLAAATWTQTCGTRQLRQLLVHAGVSGLEGWQLGPVLDIADDNRSVVGQAINAQGQRVGYFARLPKVGDADFDGLVNISDLLRIINSWGPCLPSVCPFVDVNCDGLINHVDLLSVVDNWD